DAELIPSRTRVRIPVGSRATGCDDGSAVQRGSRIPDIGAIVGWDRVIVAVRPVEGRERSSGLESPLGCIGEVSQECSTAMLAESYRDLLNLADRRSATAGYIDPTQVVPAVGLPSLDGELDRRLASPTGEQCDLHSVSARPNTLRDEKRTVEHRISREPFADV